MAGTLYLVPTPIGNLGDISRRMAETLGEVDFIAAEDTRVTLRLLNHMGLKKSLMSYYPAQHGGSRPAGAGSPAGRGERGSGHRRRDTGGQRSRRGPGGAVRGKRSGGGGPVPGPCALITALAVSGLPTARFTFEGFLPMNRKNRRALLDTLAAEERTMIFYEAPHKLSATLEDLAAAFGGDRRVSLCRELTKLHEEVDRTTLAGAVERYRTQAPRGEFVLVVEGVRHIETEGATIGQGLERVGDLQSGGLSRKDAVATGG